MVGRLVWASAELDNIRNATPETRKNKDLSPSDTNWTGRFITILAATWTRHRERSLCLHGMQEHMPIIHTDHTIETPRPTISRVTTNDGRSPGSRVTASSRLPRSPQWRLGSEAHRLQLRGQLQLRPRSGLTAFPLNPLREPSSAWKRHPIAGSIMNIGCAPILDDLCQISHGPLNPAKLTPALAGETRKCQNKSIVPFGRGR